MNNNKLFDANTMNEQIERVYACLEMTVVSAA